MIHGRNAIVDCLVAAARGADTVLALWESGSAVFGRTDEHSDIDVEAIVIRGQVEAVAELLRIRHCPQRSSWQTTYIKWDLPAEVNERLRPLVLVDGLEQMSAHLPVRLRWGKQLIRELSE